MSHKKRVVKRRRSAMARLFKQRNHRTFQGSHKRWSKEGHERLANAVTIREIIRIAKANDWRVEMTKSSHYKFFAPNGRGIVLAGNKVSTARGARNLIADLKRYGLDVDTLKEKKPIMSNTDTQSIPAPSPERPFPFYDSHVHAWRQEKERQEKEQDEQEKKELDSYNDGFVQ